MRPRLRAERRPARQPAARAQQLVRFRRDQYNSGFPAGDGKLTDASMGSRIVSTGRATPRTLLTNQDLERRMDTSDEWIRTRTGIGQRYVMSSGESLVEIAAKASEIALDRAGLKPADLDAIVVGTV